MLPLENLSVAIKSLETIQLPKTYNHSDIIKKLPFNLQKKNSVPTVTYKLANNIRNNILNYKDVVKSIYVDEEVPFSLNTDLCDNENSKSCNPHHKHIITGDLRIS